MKLPVIQKFDRIPPFLAIAIAAQVKGLNQMDLVRLTGCSRRALTRLNDSLSWESVKLRVAARVLDVCGVDPFNPDAALNQLKEFQGPTPFDKLDSSHRVKVFHMFKKLQALSGDLDKS